MTGVVFIGIRNGKDLRIKEALTCRMKIVFHQNKNDSRSMGNTIELRSLFSSIYPRKLNN